MADRDRERSGALDGLRALAALSVLGFHVWRYRLDRPHRVADRNLLDRIPFEASIGLILFFVLSGFLLYRLYLWHLPLLLVLREAGLLPDALAPRLGVVLAGSLLLAEASWRLLEQPAIAWSLRPRGRLVAFTTSKPALERRI